MSIKFKGIADGGDHWVVTFNWSNTVKVGQDEYVWLEALIRVLKTTKDEDIVRVARAIFHEIVRRAAEKSAPWHLENDVVEALSKSGTS